MYLFLELSFKDDFGNLVQVESSERRMKGDHVASTRIVKCPVGEGPAERSIRVDDIELLLFDEVSDQYGQFWMKGDRDCRHIGVDEIAAAESLCRYRILVGFSIVWCENNNIAAEDLEVLSKKVHVFRDTTGVGIVRIRTEQYSHSV